MSEVLSHADFETFITATALSMSWGDPDLRDDLEQEGRLAALTELAKPNPHPDFIRKRIERDIARYAVREGRERDHLSLDDSLTGYEPASRHDTEAEALANIERADALAQSQLTDSQAEAVGAAARGDKLSPGNRSVLQNVRRKIRRTRDPQRTQASH